jgi:hypothetical protein
MDITRWDSVEPIKNFFQIFLTDSNAIVSDGYGQIVLVIGGANFNAWALLGIFHRIVQQIVDDV